MLQKTASSPYHGAIPTQQNPSTQPQAVGNEVALTDLPPSSPEPIQLSDNRVQQHTSAETAPVKVKFSEEAILQIKAWKLPVPDLTKDQARFRILDRNNDHTIDVNELDLSGDKIASKKEFQYLLMQTPESFNRSPDAKLTHRPKPLPVSFTGPPMAEFNNPEANLKYGMQGKVTLPIGPDGKCRAFLYGNKGANAPEKGRVDLLRTKDTYHSLVVENPSKDQPLVLKISGSFLNGGKIPNYLENRPFSHGKDLMDNATRQPDHDLAAMSLPSLKEGKNQHEIKDMVIVIPPGGSLDLRSFSSKDASDFRAFYDLQVLDSFPDSYKGDISKTPLKPPTIEIASVLLPEAVNAPAAENANKQGPKSNIPAVIKRGPESTKELYKQIDNYGFIEDISDNGIREELKGAMPFASADLAIEAMSREFLPHLEALEPSPNLGSDEISGLKKRFANLIADMKEENRQNPGQPISDKILQRMNSWNAEVKMTCQVIAAKSVTADKDNVSELWKAVLPLGRVVGGKAHSEAHAVLDPIHLDGSYVEENYTLLNNPFNRGGSIGSPDVIPMISNSPNAVPPDHKPQTDTTPVSPLKSEKATALAPPDKGYGQYGVKYEIEVDITNRSGKAQALDIRFGTTDEQGAADWENPFDAFDAYLKPDQARFTGVIRLTIDGEAKDIHIAQGKVQSPQDLKTPQDLKNLLTLSSRDKPHKVKIEFYVPTNNTGPHLIQFRSGTRPDEKS